MNKFETDFSRFRFSVCAMVAAMACTCFTETAIAQTPPPARNVAPGIHPYLAQAQYLIGQANRSILSAQQANAYSLNGHAENARRLLDEASAELKAAALTANGTQP
jgi:hypothetical protein